MFLEKLMVALVDNKILTGVQADDVISDFIPTVFDLFNP
jgi:hypothetical protein